MKGVILINLGTPDAPTKKAVGRYLLEFLSDKRVLQMPALLRAILVRIIVFFRSKKSAEAYRTIWTDQGSPLIVNANLLRDRLQESLGDGYWVETAMRYQNPSIESALSKLAGCEEIIVIPLYPQYAASTYGSTVDYVYEKAAGFHRVLPVKVIPPFYDNPDFISAWVEVAGEQIKEFNPDHTVISFHGLPESQVTKASPACSLGSCCDRPKDQIKTCYRAQCYQTAKSMASGLGIEDYTVTFQSRLGPTKWLQPYTDQVLTKLAGTTKKVAVICPAFVSDNLETLEEIKVGEKERYIDAGGEDLMCVSSLNDHRAWVDCLKNMILS